MANVGETERKWNPEQWSLSAATMEHGVCYSLILTVKVKERCCHAGQTEQINLQQIDMLI